MLANSSLAYRPDIDGLRAVAVLAVVGYHAAPALIGGGFAGVDVFFVISGFLITSIIQAEKDQGDFSLLRFYARRIRRLFPALIAVLAVTFLLAWFYMLPHEFRAFGKHMTAGAAYYINFVLKREAGYFDTTSDEKPLLHLWSLAIEEQFYLVWPILILLIAGKSRLLAVLILITIASFWANIAIINRNAASAFFLPQNRFWELSAGAVLALVRSHPIMLRKYSELNSHTKHQQMISRVRDAASILGILLIACAYWGLGDHTIYPGAWALLPSTGTLLLIGASREAVINRLILARPLMILIGLISYPLYLWHWPLLSFQSILKIGDDWTFRLLAILASIGLATLTYRYIERPLRHSPSRTIPIALLAVSALFVVSGFLVKNEVIRARLDDAIYRDIGDAISDWSYPDGLATIKTASGLVVRTAGSAPGKTLYFGDSNIEQYWPRIQRQINEQPGNVSVVFATTGGCPPIPGVRDNGHPNCIDFAERVEQFAMNPEIQSVVIGAAWSGYFNGAGYYFGDQSSGGLGPGTSGTERAIGELARMIRRFRASGKSVWLVLSIPSGAELFPQSSLSRSISGVTHLRFADLNRPEFDKRWLPIRAKLVEAASAGGAEIVDPMESLCDKNWCRSRFGNGKFMYKDGSHLRASVVREHTDFIDKTLATDGKTAK